MSYLTKLPHMSTKCHLPQRTRIHFFFFCHNSWWNTDGILIITLSYVQRIFLLDKMLTAGETQLYLDLARVWRRIAESPDSWAAESFIYKWWRVDMQTKGIILPGEDPSFERAGPSLRTAIQGNSWQAWWLFFFNHLSHSGTFPHLCASLIGWNRPSPSPLHWPLCLN